tara:strand:+ start:549 stop:695 length:147 start_codon:yes stop_codon:yes gene_type:complete
MAEALKKYFENGGEVTKCPPSNKRPEPRRYAYSVFNRGNQKLKLKGTL